MRVQAWTAARAALFVLRGGLARADLLQGNGVNIKRMLAALTVVCLAVAGCARGPNRSLADAEAPRRASALLAENRPQTEAEVALAREGRASYARNMLTSIF